MGDYNTHKARRSPLMKFIRLQRKYDAKYYQAMGVDITTNSDAEKKKKKKKKNNNKKLSL